MSKPELKRKWVNQPSAQHLLRHLHGVNVLSMYENARCERIYFLAGDTISMVVDRLCLSDGWLPR